MGTEIPSWSVCWHAELLGIGTRKGWRSRHAQGLSGEFLGRRDGTRTEYSRCELFRGLRMAVTEWRGPRRRCLAPVEKEVLVENKVARTYLRRADFEQWSLSQACLGCRYGQGDNWSGRQQTHSEACRRRIESLLKGDPSGSARLAAADERINLALASAVDDTRPRIHEWEAY